MENIKCSKPLSKDENIVLTEELKLRSLDMIKQYEDSSIPVSDCESVCLALTKANASLKEKIKVYQKTSKQKSEYYESLFNCDLNESTHSGINLNELEKDQEQIQYEILNLNKKISLKKQALKELAEKFMTQEKLPGKIIPKISAEYDVFAGVFQMKWDDTAPEDKVKGYILRPGKSDVVPYELEKNNNSQYFITNYLWGQFGNPNSFME